MKRTTVEEKRSGEEGRFWNRVDRSGGEDACWLWTGCIRKSRRGYGIFHVYRKGKWRQVGAHIYVFELLNGPIGEGLVIRHLVCDNPPCVNPKHLAKGTYQDNSNDMVRKNRQSYGERHSLALMKNRPRGESHYLNLHPELRIRGEDHSTAKISDAAVDAIRAEYIPRKVGAPYLSKKYGIGETQVYNIINNISRIKL